VDMGPLTVSCNPPIVQCTHAPNAYRQFIGIFEMRARVCGAIRQDHAPNRPACERKFFRKNAKTTGQ
ncbi:hypothetical protein LXJ58_34545, partial [Escherichia coli]|nr:hypothetical protein [Escherichia coli]